MIYPFEGGRKDRKREMPSPELENEVPPGRRLRAVYFSVVRLKEQPFHFNGIFLMREIDVSSQVLSSIQFHLPNERSRLYRVSTLDANKTNLNFARPDSQRISSRDRNNPSPTLSKRGRLDMQSGELATGCEGYRSLTYMHHFN